MRKEKTMGKHEDENVMVEKDRMGLVQALQVLHTLRDLSTDEYIKEAFNTVFRWVDEMVMFLKKFGGSHGE